MLMLASSAPNARVDAKGVESRLRWGTSYNGLPTGELSCRVVTGSGGERIKIKQYPGSSATFIATGGRHGDGDGAQRSRVGCPQLTSKQCKLCRFTLSTKGQGYIRVWYNGELVYSQSGLTNVHYIDSCGNRIGEEFGGKGKQEEIPGRGLSRYLQWRPCVLRQVFAWSFLRQNADSDHGEMLGKFGMWWKCSLYEDSVRVPVIAAGPSFAHGATVRTPVDLHDVQAALFRSVGAQPPLDWVGTPLQDIPANDTERVVFAEYHGHGTRAGAYMVRRANDKYIHYAEAPDQLFDLQNDPDELENLAEQRPEIVRDMKAALRAICSPEQENERAERFIQAQLAALPERIR